MAKDTPMNEIGKRLCTYIKRKHVYSKVYTTQIISRDWSIGLWMSVEVMNGLLARDCLMCNLKRNIFCFVWESAFSCVFNMKCSLSGRSSKMV